MADNKFIAKLRGEATPKSVVEIKDDKIVKPLTGAPNSTPFESGIQDDTQSSTVVATSAQNWSLNGATLLLSDDVRYTGEMLVSGESMWVNAKYTFPGATTANPVVSIINPSSKWVLRLVGKNLASENEYIKFRLIVTAGTKNVATSTFSVRRKANYFCKKFVLDFSETADEQIKLNENEELSLQLICEDPTASATIYNGSSVLSLLQRRVDASVVVSDNVSFDDLVERTDKLRNDLDDLGDQVHDIQALIPANASPENLLTTANDLKDEADAREEADRALGDRLTELENDAVKKSATEMQTISGPVSITEETCLIDPEDNTAKHSLSIVAGVPTETAEEKDIIGNRKFDVLPTTDDATTYENLNPQKMIAKFQVAYAIAQAIEPLAVDETVVHKSDNETITGTKTFSTMAYFSTRIDTKVNPAEELSSDSVVFAETDGTYLANLRSSQLTNGTTTAGITVYNTDASGAHISATAQVVLPKGGTPYFQIPQTPSAAANTEAATAQFVRNLVQTAANPTGAVIAFAGGTAPAGYLICDGAAVSRTTYAALFAVIGTTYGAGDGKSTFNLPDCKNRVPMLLNESDYIVDAITKHFLGYVPNITGSILGLKSVQANYTDGIVRWIRTTNEGVYGSGAGAYGTFDLNAARASPTYGRNNLTYDNIIPASISMLMCIKY